MYTYDNEEDILNRLKFIQKITNNEVVFVGSSFYFLKGLVSGVNDFDFVTTNKDFLKYLNEPLTNYSWNNKGERYYYIGSKLDIFVRRELPRYQIIKGFKVPLEEDNKKVLKDIIKELEFKISKYKSKLNY